MYLLCVVQKRVITFEYGFGAFHMLWLFDLYGKSPSIHKLKFLCSD